MQFCSLPKSATYSLFNFFFRGGELPESDASTTLLLSHGKAAANAILQKKKKASSASVFGLGYALIDLLID